MSSALDTRDREILVHLHESAGGDIQALCERLGVTRTAIRQRIARLEGSGLVTSELQGHGRGRPRLIYCVTSEGLRELGENYRELAVVLWEAISGFQDEAVRSELLSHVRNRLAERFRKQLVDCDSVEDRIDQLADEMKSSGFNVESDHSGGLTILRETSCPFPMLADVDDAICQVEREVLEQVLGAPVEFRTKCQDGRGCCEFQVMGQAK
jgi:predicted ArsR family transcriptional regulator